MDASEKRCTRCGTGEIPRASASAPSLWPDLCRKCRRSASQAKWASQNPERVGARREAWLRANQGKARAHFRKSQLKQYGLTPEDYDRMLAEQGGGCAICDTTEPGHGKAVFCVDHDHATLRVRGLLCQDCNQGLGRFGDDSARLLAAERYLQRARRLRAAG